MITKYPVGRRTSQFVLFTALLAGALGTAVAAGPTSAVTGVVRDSRGTPQMGAVVELMEPNSAVVAIAYTNIHGSFVFSHIIPGVYELKASGESFLPTLRKNLRVNGDGRTAVSLTLNTLFEAAQWLPAQPRASDEPADDWKWTLRSSENRPLLRFFDGDPVVVVSGGEKQSAPRAERRVSVATGARQFGRGGTPETFEFESSTGGEGRLLLRAEAEPEIAGRGDLLAAFQQELAPGRELRTVIAFQNSAGLRDGEGRRDVQSMLTRASESIALSPELSAEFGDQIEVLAGQAAASFPFANLTWRSGDGSVTYSVATSPRVQHAEAIADQASLTPAFAEVGHTLRSEHGLHQTLRYEHASPSFRAALSAYRDSAEDPIVNGGGSPSSGDLASGDLLYDPATGTIRVAGPGYSSAGIAAEMAKRLADGLWASVGFANGEALVAELPTTRYAAESTDLAAALHAFRARRAEALSAALKGHVAGSGTSWRAAYRWQPAGTVTAVDAFESPTQDAYLSVFVRQPLHCGHMLPNGVAAVVDVRNLLAQGYRPFITADGRTLYFAQAERSLQGGLSFSF